MRETAPCRRRRGRSKQEKRKKEERGKAMREKRKVILYIAVSVDGFIADEKGGVDWLQGEADSPPGDHGYKELMKRIDTIVMGMRTYRQVKTELSPQEWAYPGKRCHVISHEPPDGEEEGEVSFTQESPPALIDRLRSEPGRDIWVCGGADIARQLMRADRIDEYHLSVIPVILGSGIRLFDQQENWIALRLLSQSAEKGIVTCVYARR